jgi:hypothetical protein
MTPTALTGTSPKSDKLQSDLGKDREGVGYNLLIETIVGTSQDILYSTPP